MTIKKEVKKHLEERHFTDIGVKKITPILENKGLPLAKLYIDLVTRLNEVDWDDLESKLLDNIIYPQGQESFFITRDVLMFQLFGKKITRKQLMFMTNKLRKSALAEMINDGTIIESADGFEITEEVFEALRLAKTKYSDYVDMYRESRVDNPNF